MPDVCTEIAKITRDIRNMLREQDKSKLNQTAALDNYKITDIKTSVIGYVEGRPVHQHGYRRTPKGKAVIYTKITDDLEPDSRDVEELVEHDRPFICRAIRLFGKDEVACYTPRGDETFKFVKSLIKSCKESEKELEELIIRKWGDIELPEQANVEKSLRKAIRHRRLGFERILDTQPAETIYDTYSRETVIVSPEKPGLASKVLNKCAFILR